MLVHHLLEKSAQQYPDKQAVWYKDQWMTYAEIDRRANQIGNYLKEVGIKRSDRVILLYENSFEYVAGYYGILKAGAVTVPLDTDTTTDSLIYYLNHSGACAAIANQKFSRNLAPAIKKAPELKHVIADQDDLSVYQEIGHCDQMRLRDVYEQMPDQQVGVRGIDLNLASIVFTSGSTGKPKGAALSHLNFISNITSIVEYLQLTCDDRVMVVLPFYYIYGKSLLNTHFMVGGSVVLDNRFAFPQVILETMEKTEVTGFSGVPSTFMILLNKSSVRKFRFASLRYVTQAGGAMAPSVQKEVAQVFAPARLYVMYGATEAAARLSYVDPEMLPQKWGSIGKAISNTDLFVTDQSGRPLGPNQVGEIAARGANIMSGYWNDPDGTSKVLKNGLYYTGDLGKMDEEGYLYVVGRSRDIIKVGGFRVSAKEVEEALLEIDQIHEVAVIGVSDATLGEAIKAIIVPRDHNSLSDDTIRKQLKDKLPTYKFPKYFEFRESLPKNESGKVLKEVLKKQQKS